MTFPTRKVRISELFPPEQPEPDRCSPLVPIKVRIRNWQARLGRLPSKDNLIKRGIAIGDDRCYLCHESSETGDHIFLSCRKANEVRRAINIWWNLLPTHARTMEEFFNDLGRDDQPAASRNFKEIIGQAYIWAMWNGRNEAIFNNKSFDSLRTANAIQSFAFGSGVAIG